MVSAYYHEVKITTSTIDNFDMLEEGERPYLFFVLSMELIHPAIGRATMDYKIDPKEIASGEWQGVKRDKALCRLFEALILKLPCDHKAVSLDVIP